MKVLTFFFILREKSVQSLTTTRPLSQQAVQWFSVKMPWKTSEKTARSFSFDVDLDEIKRRVTNIKTRGIAFGKGETLDDVYRVRYPLYKKYADITVSMELSSIETTVDAIVEKLKLEKQN